MPETPAPMITTSTSTIPGSGWALIVVLPIVDELQRHFQVGSLEEAMTSWRSSRFWS